jgi:O-antigen/teichoic acid export membrane protein
VSEGRAIALALANRLRRIAARLGWGLADQSLSSLTNFSLGVFVARSLAPREFGAFGIAYGVYTTGLAITRAVTSEPLMVRYSVVTAKDWLNGVRAAAGTAFSMGVVGGLVCVASGQIAHGVLGSALTALGVTMPGLLLQDTWRYAFFSHRRGGAAFVNDLVWAIALVCWMVFLLWRGSPSVGALVLAWGGSGSIGGLFGILQSRLVPSPARSMSWFREQADLIPRFVGEFGVSTLATQATVFAIGAVAGLASVGAIRAGQLLLGPLNVVYQGVGLVAIPEGVRVLQVSEAKLRRTCVGLSAGLAFCALGLGVVASTLPDRFGMALLGQNWPFAQEVVFPLSISMAGFGVVLGAGIGLRALAAAAMSLRARLLVAPVVVASAVGGAALWGARGAAWGFAVAYSVGSLVWWGYFQRALRDHERGRIVSSGAAEEPGVLEPEPGFTS